MTQQNKVCTRHNEGRKDTNKGTSTQSGTSRLHIPTHIEYIHMGLSHAVSLKENIHFNMSCSYKKVYFYATCI